MGSRRPIEGSVGLGMYPFPELRPAWERLWQGVTDRLPWLPSELTWHDDLHEAWRSDDLLVDHTCGWPLVTQLSSIVRVVGAFESTVPEADGPTYRSVLVARTPIEPVDAEHVHGLRAAVNDAHSLSGWVSLLAAVHGTGAPWQGPVVWTGAHVESVRALHDDVADIASIDALTWAHITSFRPELVVDLHVVGHGPRVPALPVVVGRRFPDDELPALRRALHDTVVDPGFADDARLLRLRGFIPLDLADYLPLRELARVV